MKTLLKGLQLILAVLVLGFVTAAQAIPTLHFDGTLDFTTGIPGSLSVSATLNGSTDVLPAPVLAGSSLSLNADFLNSTTIGMITRGYFTNAAGDDLVITDGAANTLLIAELVEPFTIRGMNGLNGGNLEGHFLATGGNLLSVFGTSETFATTLFLTNNFSSTMFDTDFNGTVNGNIFATPAPEPGMLVLLSLGLGLFSLGAQRKQKA